MFNTAISLIQNNRLEEAKNLLDRLATQNDSAESIEAIQLLALVNSKLGEYEIASRQFRRYLEVRPDNHLVWCNYGNHTKDIDLDTALSCYQRSIHIKPEFMNATYGLALVQFKKNLYTEALTRAQNGKRLSEEPRFDRLLGHIFIKLNQFEKAANAFRDSLHKAPEDGSSILNLAISLRKIGDYQSALNIITSFLTKPKNRSEALMIEKASLFLELGLLQSAIATLKEITEYYPLSLIAHEKLDATLYETGHEKFIGQSLRDAWTKTSNTELLVELATRMAKLGRKQESLLLIQQLTKQGHSSIKSICLQANLIMSQGDISQAISCFETGRKKFAFSRELNLSYCRLLTVTGKVKYAQDIVEEILQQNPVDQEAHAYLATIWKLSKSEKYGWLCDYQKLIKTYNIVDGNYTNSDLEALILYLRDLHKFSKEPMDQSLHGGTQTFGSLLSRAEPEIKKLRNRLEELVSRYILSILRDSQHRDVSRHPFYQQFNREFQFVGSWSVSLRKNGFHINHTHREGWLSSALYLVLPPRETNNYPQGCLQFGKSNLGLPDDVDPTERIMTPEVGKLVIFPSYFWHGTIPFTSGKERLTVAFDVRPRINANHQ